MTPGIPLLIGGERAVVIGHTHCLLESKSNPGQWHSVSYELENGAGVWRCTCPSGTIRKTCRHIDTVRDWLNGKVTATIEEPE